MATTPLSMNDIRIAAERLIQEAQLHRVEYGTEAHPNVNDDILLVGPAALAGLDLQVENVRLREALDETRRHALAVVGASEAYGETESAHLWQEVADIADKALG